MIDHLPDPSVGADVEIPGVALAIAAIGGIFHRELLGGAVPEWQRLRGGILDGRARVPAHMKRQEQPVIVIDETRIDGLLDLGRLAAELRAQIRDLERLAGFVFALNGHPIRLGLPDP
jgi:hypothetical protein